MVCTLGIGRSQLMSLSGTNYVQLCGHVQLLLLNLADYSEYSNWKVGVRASTTSSAY